MSNLHFLYRSARWQQPQDRGFKLWLGQPKNNKIGINFVVSAAQ